MKCFCAMAFAARCAARWCRGETHRSTTSFHGKMVVVTCRTIFKFCALPVTPRNFGMNTTPENKKNFKQSGCRTCWKTNFQKSVRKNFQAKPFQVAVRINRKKCVCLYGMLFGAFSVHIVSIKQNLFFVFWTIGIVRKRIIFKYYLY